MQELTAPHAEFTASLSSLGKICWMRLEGESVRFTIIPDQGTQVWAQLPIVCFVPAVINENVNIDGRVQDSIFDENYTLEAATGSINLEVPVGALSRALRSAIGATSAQLRLTKKGAVPLLALTVVTSSWTSGSNALGIDRNEAVPGFMGALSEHDDAPTQAAGRAGGPRERETVITQEIPVKVLHQSVVEGLHEPRSRDPDVHIILPSLAQLKAISDRFTKLALSSGSKTSGGGASLSSSTSGPKLELSANMHGSLKLGIATDSLRISSVWTGLVNPPLDPAQLSQTEIDQLPSERMRVLGAQANADEEVGWAKVRIDGKDWGRVLSVGRLSPKVVACKGPSFSA
jgi:HUS1 checkpoint protein